MAFTQAEEDALRSLITGMSNEEIASQKVAATERNLDEKAAIMRTEKAAVDAAYNSLVASLGVWKASVAGRDSTVISSAKSQFMSDLNIYQAALQNARTV